MSTEENRIRKEIREVWQILLELAWEYSDRFDLMRKWLERPEDKAGIGQLSPKERTLRSKILESDIPQIRELVRQGKDIHLNKSEYRISREMLGFQSRWHDQQERLFHVLMDGIACSVVKKEEIPWFINRLDTTTDHHRRQFQSLLDGLNKCVSTGLSETKGQEESQSQSGCTELSRETEKVKDPPELKSAHEVLTKVASDMNVSLKKLEEEREPVLNGKATLRGNKAALHGQLIDLEREYPPSPFAE